MAHSSSNNATDKPLIQLVNGKVSDSISLTDRGLHYGDGLFETIAIKDGRPLLWDQHLDRLLQGCDRLCIEDIDESLLTDEIMPHIKDIKQGVLKLIVTRGEGGRSYRFSKHACTRIAMVYQAPNNLNKLRTEGVNIIRFHAPFVEHPSLHGIKHLNRLPQVLVSEDLQIRGAYEGIMFTADDIAIEGSFTNVFMVKEGTLYATDLNRQGLSGIMRYTVMQLAIDHGCHLMQKKLTDEDLLAADEIFLTNSIIGVVPVIRYEETSYAIGDITTSLQKLTKDLAL